MLCTTLEQRKIRLQGMIAYTFESSPMLLAQRCPILDLISQQHQISKARARGRWACNSGEMLFDNSRFPEFFKGVKRASEGELSPPRVALGE